MFNIVDDEGFQEFSNFLSYLEEMEDPDKLKNEQLIGRHSNVVFDFDTGIGKTIEDLYNEDRDEFYRLKNYIILSNKALDHVEDVFKDV